MPVSEKIMQALVVLAIIFLCWFTYDISTDYLDGGFNNSCL